MEENLYKILKELKKIRPDSGYSQRSRFLILSSKTQTKTNFALAPTDAEKNIEFANVLHWLQFHRLAAATSLIAVFVLIVFLVVSYLPGNKNALVAEANEINASIQIKLNELNYQLQYPTEINVSEINNASKILDQMTQMLKEAQELNVQDEAKESLAKIKLAQKMFLEVESRLKKQN